jgi:sec-independent protein translocase protein TatA
MTSTITPLLIGGLGGMELLIVLAVLVLLFGASKLPELARGSGQALKIFKAETKGLIDSDDKDTTSETKSETPREHDAPRA